MAKSIFYIIVFLLAAYGLVCLFYYVFQERFVFVPFWGKRRGEALTLASPTSEVNIDGREGGRLNGVWIKTEQPRGAILYFHGNTGSISRWASIAEEFTSFGFDVLVPDYRGFGKSVGKRTEEILYADALLWYKLVNERFPEDKICVYGRSLGSGMAAWLSGRTQPAAMVLETPYDNLISVAYYRTRVIPVKMFLRFTFRSDIHIRRCSSPLFIAHGTKDKVIPYRLGLRLYRIAKRYTHAEMLTIPGGKHATLNGFPVFRDKLTSFFDRYIPPIDGKLGDARIPLRKI